MKSMYVQIVHNSATVYAINVKGRMYGLVSEGNGRRGGGKQDMPRMLHLIWDGKQLALGLVNPQCSSPSTLMNKDCTVCGELKIAL